MPEIINQNLPNPKYKIAEIKPNIYQDFAIGANYNTFLQSLGWQEFNRLNCTTSWLLGMFEAEKLVSVAMVLKVVAKRGTFLFVPHGPLFGDFGQEITETEQSKIQEMMCFWTDYLKEMAKIQKCSFVRIQPIMLKNTNSQTLFEQNGYRRAPIHMHTELSTNVDLTPEYEQILLNMRKTTRQMIKKAEKMVASGEVVVEDFEEVGDELYVVYESTYQRGGFVPYSQKYLHNEFMAFNSNQQKNASNNPENSSTISQDNIQKARLYGVRYKGQLISWGLVLVFGQRAFYHQGANLFDKSFKEVPNSYLTQWEGIKFAKESGCISYDFWGVAPKEDLAEQPKNKSPHPWASISLFKRGFGTTDTQLLEAQDLIISPMYWFTWLIETYRAKVRGF